MRLSPDAMKRLIAFDLDGTLAESKQAIDAEMGSLLAGLSRLVIIAVISGGDWPQFEQQLIGNLPNETDLSRWFLLPTSGTKLYRHADGEWRQVYAQSFSTDERARILSAFDTGIATPLLAEDRTWATGSRIAAAK